MSRHRKKIPKSTRRRVMRRDLWLCSLRFDGCTGQATELHHIKPVSAGGDNEDDNLCAVCRSCHKRHHEADPKNCLGEKMLPAAAGSLEPETVLRTASDSGRESSAEPLGQLPDTRRSASL